MTIKYSKKLYPQIALFKAAYSFTDIAYIHLDASDEYYIVSISAKEGHEELSEDAFNNEILYQTVKHEVYTQTKDIRSLIMARAMASTVIEKTVTYEPKNEDASTSEIDTMSILTNWFDKND